MMVMHLQQHQKPQKPQEKINHTCPLPKYNSWKRCAVGTKTCQVQDPKVCGMFIRKTMHKPWRTNGITNNILKTNKPG